PGLTGDYLPVTGLLIFSPTITNQDFIVNVIDDAKPETTETIELVLNNVIGAVPGTNFHSEILILDDDGPPSLTAPLLSPDEHFQTTVRGPSGQAFSLQASLELTNWTTIAALTNTTGVLEWTDPAAVTNGARRFYRTKLP